MADPSKSTSAFAFGNATPSSGGKGLFGSTPSSAPSSTGLFGSAAIPTTNPTASVFGSTAASTAQPGSLFGIGAGGPATSSPFGGASKPAIDGGFHFGPSTTNNSGTKGMFGSSQPSSQSGQPASSAPSGSLFSTPNKPADAAAASKPFGGPSGGGGLFTSKAPSGEVTATTPTSKQNISLFGNSTTPAGPPPGANKGTGNPSLFNVNKPEGQSNSSSSIFGGLGRTMGDAPSNQPTKPSLFAPPTGPTADATQLQISQAPSQGSNMFGAQSNNASGRPSLFGVTSSAPQSKPQAVLFNTLKQPQDSSNSKPVETRPTLSTFSNFGSQSTSEKQPATNTNPSPFFSTALKQPSTPSFSFEKPPGIEAASTSSMESPSTAPSASPFGIPVASSATTSIGISAPSATAPTTSFLPSLGQPQQQPADTAGTSAPSSEAPPTSASNLFGNLGKSLTSASSSQPQAPNTAILAGENKPTTANLAASTTGPVPPTRSRLKDKTMDDIITRWASDLSKYQKDFQAQAEKVASWDRMLVENSEKIQRLYGSTLEAERATTEVERQLTSVESDQAELESWLTHYEGEVDNMIQTQVGQGDGLSGPDQERERTYQLATKLSDRLEDMGRDLGSMIEEINDASSNLSKHAKSDDPLTQVVRVLNSHLTQLQQIDQGTASLQLKVKEAQKAGQRMGPPSGLSGPSSDAAEGFYRLYMGRG